MNCHGGYLQLFLKENRTPDSGMKGSGANHYPRAPAQLERKEIPLQYKHIKGQNEVQHQNLKLL